MKGKEITAMIMRIFVGMVFLLVGVLPVHAAQGGFYLGAWGGGTFLDESKVHGHEGRMTVDYKEGTAFGASVGYDLGARYPQVGQGRVEIEYAYRSNDLKDARFSDGRFAADGDVSVWSLMFNSFGEFHGVYPWVPYVGLGLGYARVSLNDARVPGGELGDDSDGVFAYQFGVGFGYQLNRLLTLDIGYRYFGTLDATLQLADQTTVDWSYDNHAVLLGLRLKLY
jgi:opacity protein-like surface antigen